MVRGADGNEYGPATFEQLTEWGRQGRLQTQQEVKRNDMEHWAAAGSVSELQPIFAPNAGPPPLGSSVAAATAADPATEARLKSGASWFYWIAGLSLINTISAFTGSDWRFIVGLGITQLLDAFGTQFGGAGKIVVLVLDLLAAGSFVLLGVFAHKCRKWAFVTGMVLFALDGLIFMLVQDWIGVAFHVFVLYCLLQGLKACQELNEARE